MADDTLSRRSAAEQLLRIGVAGRPHPHETVSGDAHAIHWSENTCRIAVIDGLGHGIDAAVAAQCAIEALDTYPTADPVEALQRCHTALLGTRGAAISVAYLNLADGELTYAGVGNVEAHIWQAGRHERLIAYRGIIGSAMRTVRSFTVPLSASWTLVMHSDGISARASLDALGVPAPQEPQAIAEALLKEFGRQLDDALAVVVQPPR